MLNLRPSLQKFSSALNRYISEGSQSKSDKEDLLDYKKKRQSYNLLMLKKLGLDEYIEKSGQLLTQWARGKTIPPGGDVQVQMDADT